MVTKDHVQSVAAAICKQNNWSPVKAPKSVAVATLLNMRGPGIVSTKIAAHDKPRI